MSEYRRRSDFYTHKRTLYALVFDEERAVYIGQSIAPKRRRQQHASKAGGWLRPFRMLTLETMEGTFAQAEEREYVWRWVAHLTLPSITMSVLQINSLSRTSHVLDRDVIAILAVFAGGVNL